MLNYLQLYYSPTFFRLYFSDCDIQEIILKNVDIHQVTKFIALDEDDQYFMEIRNLFYYRSVFDLMYFNDDYGYRFMGAEIFLNNGIRIIMNLNLTTIYATSVDQLFDYIAPSINNLGFDANVCIELIKSRPAEQIAISIDEEGILKADKWSEEFRKEWYAKSWSNEVSEEGDLEIVPF